MLNIGVVGDAHTVAFARLINVEKRIRGVRVSHVWGETASQARAAAADGQIPHIVKSLVK